MITYTSMSGVTATVDDVRLLPGDWMMRSSTILILGTIRYPFQTIQIDETAEHLTEDFKTNRCTILQIEWRQHSICQVISCLHRNGLGSLSHFHQKVKHDHTCKGRAKHIPNPVRAHDDISFQRTNYERASAASERVHTELKEIVHL